MTLRISTNQVLDTGVQAMDNSLSQAMNWQQKIDSGKNYSKASDNAYAMSRGVRLQFDTDRLNMYSTNQNFVASSMSNTDTQMTSIVNQMNAIKQLMVQSNDGSLNASNYQALQQAAQGYLDSIKQMSTAQDGTGKPIFASTVNQVQIDPNLTVNTNLKYSDVFGGSGSGKTDVIQKIQDFVNYLGNLASGKTVNPGQSYSVSSGVAIGRLTAGPANYMAVSGLVANANAQIGAFTIQTQTANGVTSVFLQNGAGNQTIPVAVPANASSIDFGNGVVISLTQNGTGDTGANIAAALAGKTITVSANQIPGTTQTVSNGLDQAFSQLTVMQEVAGALAKRVDDAKGATASIGTNLAATSSALLDTDMAAATAQYTKAQTILSAAEAMFAKISQSNLFSKL
jgi:flagellin-like hook-associated protein FlgL